MAEFALSPEIKNAACHWQLMWNLQVNKEKSADPFCYYF